MPQFRYTIIDKTNKRLTKVTTASSRAELVAQLTKSQVFIVKIDDISRSATSTSRRISGSDKIFFTQNIAVLLNSGVSLGEALGIIADDTSNKSVAALYESIKSDLEQGASFAQALNKYPLLFDSVYISLVEAGESSGELADVMSNLAKSLERDMRTLHQVRSALIYPAIVLVALLILGGLITFFVLPKVTQVFKQLNVKLPFMTQLLVTFGDFASKNTLLLVVLLFGTLIGLGIFFYSNYGRRLIGKMGIHTPFIKQIINNLDLSRLSSILALLLDAGVPIQKAISIGAGTVKNPRLSEEFRGVAQRLETGVALGQALKETSLPKTFVALVSTGERSGNITAILKTLADYYTERLDTAVKDFTGVLEPTLTLLVGLLVGGVVITILVPIYQFIGNLQAPT